MIKVKDLLDILDSDVDGTDYVVFYNCGKKIGYYNETELDCDRGICKLLDAVVEMISTDSDSYTLKIHILFGDE